MPCVRPNGLHVWASINWTGGRGAATADLYPCLSLGGFLGFFALRGSSVFDVGARAFEVTLAATLPALRIGSAGARVRAPEAEAQGALAVYR